MAAVLKGYGPNDLTLIIMVFESTEKGKSFLEEVFKKEADKQHNGSLFWRTDRGEFDNVATFKEGDKYPDYENSPAVKALFSSYYDGCGDIWMVELLDIPYATPVISFSLD
jgi:hypothetical protein